MFWYGDIFDSFEPSDGQEDYDDFDRCITEENYADNGDKAVWRVLKQSTSIVVISFRTFLTF